MLQSPSVIRAGYEFFLFQLCLMILYFLIPSMVDAVAWLDVETLLQLPSHQGRKHKESIDGSHRVHKRKPLCLCPSWAFLSLLSGVVAWKLRNE